MLLNKLYTIQSSSSSESTISCEVLLNSSYPIFEGHFPDIPIVPGVVFLQMVKEIFENHLQMTLFLEEAKSLKFLDFVNPKEIDKLEIKITYEPMETSNFKVQASITSDRTTHFKMNANYIIKTN